MVDLNYNGIEDDQENQSTPNGFNAFLNKNYPIDAVATPMKPTQTTLTPVAPVPVATTPVAPTPTVTPAIAPAVPSPQYNAEKYINAMPATKSNITDQTSVSTKTVKQTQGEKDLEKARNLLVKNEVDNINAQQKIQEQVAGFKQKEAKDTQDASVLYNNEVNRIQKEGGDNYIKLQGELKTQSDTLKSMKVKDFWEDKSTGSKVLAAISIALGAMGAAYAGGKNYALDIITGAIDNDYKKQMAQIELQKSILENTGRATEQNRQQIAFMQAGAANKKAAAYEMVKGQFDVQATTLGTEQAKLNAQNAIDKLSVNENAARMETEKGLRTIVDSHTSKQVTEIPTNKEEILAKYKIGQEEDARKAQMEKDKRGTTYTPDQLKMVEEYRSSPVVKATDVVATSYNKVVENAKLETAQGDMALIYGYMRMQDPASTVRESEFDMAAKAGSFGDQVRVGLERLNIGEKLTPQMRIGFINSAKVTNAAQIKQADVMRDRMTADAKAAGMDKPEEMFRTVAPKQEKKKTVVKQQRNKTTGAIKTIYDDGSEEITDGK